MENAFQVLLDETFVSRITLKCWPLFPRKDTKAAFFSCSNSACWAKTGSHHGLAKQACEDVPILGCSLTHYRFSPSFPAPEPALRVLIRLLRYRGLFT